MIHAAPTQKLNSMHIHCESLKYHIDVYDVQSILKGKYIFTHTDITHMVKEFIINFVETQINKCIIYILY